MSFDIWGDSMIPVAINIVNEKITPNFSVTGTILNIFIHISEWYLFFKSLENRCGLVFLNFI
jgi:hypothetical protein